MGVTVWYFLAQFVRGMHLPYGGLSLYRRNRLISRVLICVVCRNHLISENRFSRILFPVRFAFDPNTSAEYDPDLQFSVVFDTHPDPGYM